MAFIGRLHPLLVHFPIALVIAGVVAEAIAARTDDPRWRIVAARNLQAGAVAAAFAAVAGWWLALSPGMEPTGLLEAHRWVGSVAAVTALVAAFATTGGKQGVPGRRAVYRAALWSAGALVAVAAHLGGMLVWGSNFLRP